MTRPKIMIVYGTRPEAIKVAPLIKALASDDRFECVVASTGQHREMLDQVHEMFGITPDVELAIMRAGQTLNDIVSRVIAALDEVFEREQPHAVVVHGDTSTAMAAAIAAFNRGSKIIHLEAGLRTSTLHSPFPEEANRRVISRLASLHLAPTSPAKQHLLAENTPPASIVVTVAFAHSGAGSSEPVNHTRRSTELPPKRSTGPPRWLIRMSRLEAPGSQRGSARSLISNERPTFVWCQAGVDTLAWEGSLPGAGEPVARVDAAA